MSTVLYTGILNFQKFRLSKKYRFLHWQRRCGGDAPPPWRHGGGDTRGDGEGGAAARAPCRPGRGWHGVTERGLRPCAARAGSGLGMVVTIPPLRSGPEEPWHSKPVKKLPGAATAGRERRPAQPLVINAAMAATRGQVISKARGRRAVGSGSRPRAGARSPAPSWRRRQGPGGAARAGDSSIYTRCHYTRTRRCQVLGFLFSLFFFLKENHEGRR